MSNTAIAKVINRSYDAKVHKLDPNARSDKMLKDLDDLGALLQTLPGAEFKAAITQIYQGYSDTRSLLADERGVMNMDARQALCTLLLEDRTRPAQEVAKRLIHAQDILTASLAELAMPHEAPPSDIAIKLHEGMHALFVKINERRGNPGEPEAPTSPKVGLVKYRDFPCKPVIND